MVRGAFAQWNKNMMGNLDPWPPLSEHVSLASRPFDDIGPVIGDVGDEIRRAAFTMIVWPPVPKHFNDEIQAELNSPDWDKSTAARATHLAWPERFFNPLGSELATFSEAMLARAKTDIQYVMMGALPVSDLRMRWMRDDEVTDEELDLAFAEAA